jgi:membrane protein implicated in regulation of membrane protease activity
VASVGGPIAAQLAVFIVASIGTLALIRPIARRHLRTPASIRTGTAALIGTRALVLDRVDADSGQVKIGGEVWTARPYDEDDVYEAGARVEVVKIQGATALVQE